MTSPSRVPPSSAGETRRTLLRGVLETSRTVVAARLKDQGLDLSARVSSPVTHDNPAGGFTLGQEEVAVSPLRDPEFALILRGDDSPFQAPEAREVITALAKHLEATTDLGDRPSPFGASEAGRVETIAARVVVPLALHYLRELPDLTRDDGALVRSTQDELEAFTDATSSTVIDQIAIKGACPETTLSWRGVTLRPLSPAERGAAAMATFPSHSLIESAGTEFVIPRKLGMFFPSALLETSQEVSWGWWSKEHPVERVFQLILSFLINHYEIGTSESLVTFERPGWAGAGTLTRHFPVSGGRGITDRAIGAPEFQEIVDTAFRLPPFGTDEQSRQEVALYRALRGASSEPGQSGLLDFAISLEAALLPKIDRSFLIVAVYTGHFFCERSSHRVRPSRNWVLSTPQGQS